MGPRIEKEINILKNEQNLISESLAAERESFALSLENGLGESILKELSKPKPKETKWTKIKNNFKRVFNI